MRPNLLILGGTTQARDLAIRVAQLGMAATYSYAGATATPAPQPVPVRVGGFGGAEGLAAYMAQNKITHIIDATHPFAAQISRNAVAASQTENVPLLALTRSPWTAVAGDDWKHVESIAEAVQALSQESKRVFLAIGRNDIAAFAAAPQHFYLLRFVDAPKADIPLPNAKALSARGPFEADAEAKLLFEHRIDLVVSKNSGGDGARAKLDAARALGLPVLMIDRPQMPPRHEVDTVDAVIDWLAHDGTERGV